MNVAVLVSGGGTNLAALFEAIDAGRVTNAQISLVVSSRADAYALKRARDRGVDTAVLEGKDFASASEYDAALIELLRDCGAELIVLAGYLRILGAQVIAAYPNRIINVHPSLIPSFCGAGCYGLHVHERALEYGVKISGASVHFVSEEVDGGAIIAQKAVKVRDDDTPHSLQQRIMREAEWVLLPAVVDAICNGRVDVDGRRVKIKEGINV